MTSVGSILNRPMIYPDFFPVDTFSSSFKSTIRFSDSYPVKDTVKPGIQPDSSLLALCPRSRWTLHHRPACGTGTG